MSRFIEKLERAAQGMPAPMGFAAAARRAQEDPPFVVTGTVEAASLRGADALLDAVDALLVEMEQAAPPEGLAQALEGRLWGARPAALDGEGARALREAGADFVVFGPEAAAADLLLVEDLAKLVAIGPELDEDAARALNDLPLDGVLYRPEAPLRPLTVGRLIELDKVRSLLDMPFVVETAEALGPGELAALREVAVYGVALPLADGGLLEAYRRAVSGLPRRRPRPQRERSVAYVPQASASEEEWEEEEYRLRRGRRWST